MFIGKSLESLPDQSIAALSGRWNDFYSFNYFSYSSKMSLIIQVIHEYILNVKSKSNNAVREKYPLDYSSSVLVSSQ